MSTDRPFDLSRRSFLKIVVASAIGAGATGLIGCGDDGEDGQDPNQEPQPDAPATEAVFPQSVASGDPTDQSVILWTRAVPDPEGDDPSGDVEILYEVAKDEAFAEIIASGELTAESGADHTVRLKITDLDPHTIYFYRFSARGAVSNTGRTRTAPSADQDVPVRLAFASCQDFNGRYYHAWEVLAEQEEVDFVLFLGDYVYETTNDPRFQISDPERQINIPEGLQIGEDNDFKAALTLDDYRGLYKQHRSDRSLQKAHERFAFVTIWDDHEFADDSWQDHATHFNDLQGDEKDTARRTVANQAWFEYQPADVTRDAAADYPNDLQIFRSLRFGQHVELVVTDQRSYRDEHVIPEGPADLTVGKFGENSAVGARNFVLKAGFDPREAEGNPSMLGQEQRQWLIDTLSASNATWKLWGSETQLSQMLVDLSSFPDLPEDFQDVFYFSVDQWDGYRTERAALLQELSSINNLVVLTGDIHAFYASELHTDFDNPTDPVAVEYVCAGISSGSVQSITQQTVDANPLLATLGLGDLVPRFDELLQAASPHYKLARSNANGIAIMEVTQDAVEVTFLQVSDVLKPDFDGQVTRTTLRTASGTKTIEVMDS